MSAPTPYRVRSSVEMFHPALYGLARLQDTASKDNPALANLSPGKKRARKVAGSLIYAVSGPCACVDYLAQMALYPSFGVYSHTRSLVFYWKKKDVKIGDKLGTTIVGLPLATLVSLVYSSLYSVKKILGIALECTFIPTIYRLTAGNSYTNLFFADRSVKYWCAERKHRSVLTFPSYTTHTVREAAKAGSIHNYTWTANSMNDPTLGKKWAFGKPSSKTYHLLHCRNLTELIKA